MNIRRHALSLLLAATLAAPAFAASPERGRLLYENHCFYCHWRNVHFRPRGKVHSLGDLEREIRLWQAELDLDWNDRDVADVLDYLDWLYYGFPYSGLIR